MEENNKKGMILIVDDTQRNIQVLGSILMKEKYQISVAKNGLEALKVVKNVMPDIILLDIMMPELDGFETCKRLKESDKTKDIPVIFLTAKIETEDIIKGFELGAVDYITKPFNSKELLVRVNTHLDLKYAHEKIKKSEQILRAKNDELNQQNEEIQSINEALNEQKGLVEERNTELNAQNEEITTQRDQLSDQNKSINESILYAKRIQTAVLPRQAYIDELLPENFILFKPRDVVSGDFYWIRHINQYIVIAVADCTGHGVPGAIMSMLGMSFINEIVQKREITKANQVLNELRKQIKQALRQTGRKGEADDGMDMALCALDTKTNILQYSGANNPLYIIKNGELKEIKADRMPIGYYPNEKPSFTNHEIQLNDGDIFYLFSDGFMDQFGGKKGFKYKAGNFQKVLLENHNKPMIIQKELLEQELKSWMKGYEQTDDILVMGVRV